MKEIVKKLIKSGAIGDIFIAMEYMFNYLSISDIRGIIGGHKKVPWTEEGICFRISETEVICYLNDDLWISGIPWDGDRTSYRHQIKVQLGNHKEYTP